MAGHRDDSLWIPINAATPFAEVSIQHGDCFVLGLGTLRTLFFGQQRILQHGRKLHAAATGQEHSDGACVLMFIEAAGEMMQASAGILENDRVSFFADALIQHDGAKWLLRVQILQLAAG